MATEFHERVHQLIEHLISIAPAERAGILAELKRSEPQLAADVETLLPHYERMARFDPTRSQRSKLGLPGASTLAMAETAARSVAWEDEEIPVPFSIEQYKVTDVVGRGGMGIVYKATHATSRKPVAIKLLRRGLKSSADRHRFAFEVEVLRRLEHPGVAKLQHAGIARLAHFDGLDGRTLVERPYFVMEFIEGEPLTQYAGRRDLCAHDRLSLLYRICEAVAYAHHRGLIHRDLKPDNILIDRKGEPKILDFGIARLQEFQHSLFREEDGSFIGTLRYASPEQREGRAADLSPRCDVYSLGLIAHELLCGSLPQRDDGRWRFATHRVTLGPTMREPTPDDAEFRYYLGVILATALEQCETRRYAMAGELGENLARLCEQFPKRSGDGWVSRLVRWALGSATTFAASSATAPLKAVMRKRIDMAMRFTPLSYDSTPDAEQPIDAAVTRRIHLGNGVADTALDTRELVDPKETTEHLPHPRQIPDNSSS